MSRYNEDTLAQQPTQRLKTLCEHALIESAVSSNCTELQAGVREQLHDRIAARLPTLAFDYGDTP